MKVLTSEINRILISNDYSLFKYAPKPKFYEKRLMMLIGEMGIKNLSKDLPIIVDKEYNILDGVYRYEANKVLKCPIYYKVAEIANQLDLMKAESLIHKPTDFEFLYYHRDKLAYRKVLEWCELLPYSYTEIIYVLGQDYLNKRKASYIVFKDGEMEYTKEHDFKLKRVQEFITKFTELYDYFPIELDTLINNILSIESFNVDASIQHVKKLKYFTEFVKLFNEGHPDLQSTSNYFEDAFKFSWELHKGNSPSISDTETKYQFWGRGDKYSREYQGLIYPTLNTIHAYYSL